MARRLLIAAAALLVGCEPSIPDGTLLCRVDDASEENCPEGFTCCPAPEREGYDGVCARVGCDGGVGPDGGMDAGGVDDGGRRDAGGTDAGTPDAGPPPVPVQVAAGGIHTCARWSDGRVFCWGNNEDGRLGNGTTDTGVGETRPVAVIGLPPDIEEVAAGGKHSCARSADAAWCWGDNQHGQLGDGSSSMLSDEPARVMLPAGLTLVSLGLGEDHACVVSSEGNVYCWGRNHRGQLGRMGSFDPSPVPSQVMGVSGAVQVVGGFAHTCARLTDGSVSCWGTNGNGELGRDTTSTSEPTPMLVMGIGGMSGPATRIAAGSFHTCAIVGAELRCWGDGGNGRLGDGMSADRLVPTPVVNLPGDPTLVGGGGTAILGHTCAAGPDLAVHCWGSRLSGQLGDGMWLTNAVEPVPTTPLPANPTALSAGGEHTCVIVNDRIYCWGKNGNGQLGDSTTSTSNTPVETDPPT